MLVRIVRVFDGLVYDVGASSGIYSLLAVEARPGVRAVAFEPFPPALDALRANIALNRSGSRIEIVEAAVADMAGTSDLFVPADSGVIETSASLNSSFKESIDQKIAVRTVTLDDDWNRRHRPHVSLIKIDTESTEAQVLRGGAEIVSVDRPLIIFEVLPSADLDALRAYAHDHDLVTVRLTGTTATIGGEVDHDPRSWNQIFVPRERRNDIVPLLEAARLAVTDA